MTSTRHIAARWYAFGYLREVVLMYPVYAIMMGAHGIAPLELSVLFIVWSGSALVFEVPSGVLADRYSRKRLLVASGLIKGSVFVVWWFAPNFWGYLCGFIVWGFGSSLVSGTSESFLFDTLKQRAQPEAFARIYGRGLMANSLGVATALAAGGYAAQAGYAIPMAESALAPMLASLIVVFTFVEPPRSGLPLAHTRATDTLVAGVKEVRGNRAMMWTVAMFASLVTAYGVLDEYIGPFLTETRSFSLGAIGVIYAALYAMRTLGMEAAHRLPAGSLRAIAVVLGIGSLALGTSTVLTGFAIAVAIGIYFALTAAAEVLLQTQLQQQIEGTARATVTSLAKMAQHACEPAFLLFIGGVAQAWSFNAAFAGVAAITLALAIVFATLAPAQGR
jgi:MFS family permease